MLLSEAWRKYQSDKKLEGYSPLTLKMYGFQYNLVNRYFGDVTMNEFSTESLKQYLIDNGAPLEMIQSLLRSKKVKQQGYTLI